MLVPEHRVSSAPEATGASGEPLLDGFRAIVGDELAAVPRAVRAHRSARLAAGHHVRLRAQHVLALARRLLPEVPLAHRQARRRRGSLSSSARVIGFIAFVLARCDSARRRRVAGAIVLNIAVWGAVIAYILQMVSFVILRKKFPNAKRPVREPTGRSRARSSRASSRARIFVGFLLNEAFRPAIVAIVVVYIVMLVGFALFGRNRLVLSPEEEYALSGRQARRPASGGLRRHGEGDVRRLQVDLSSSSGLPSPDPNWWREATRGLCLRLKVGRDEVDHDGRRSIRVIDDGDEPPLVERGARV